MRTGVAEVVKGIFQVAVPVPFPLKAVNCYLIREQDGWSLVDTGLQDGPALEAWAHAFDTLAIEPRTIRQIVVTHAHPDHYGLAGHFQALAGARVWMLDKEIAVVPVEWHPEGAHMHEVVEFLEANGLPHGAAEGILERQMQVLAMVQPQPELSPLYDGQEVLLGGCAYHVIWTPGHADGHAVLYRKADGLLLAGDMILAKITPNIALWPGLEPDPLKRYLTSLDRLDTMAVSLGLTGHRAVIHDVKARVAELRAHHAARLEECMIAAGEGASAYEVCLRVFPHLRSVDDVRMAMVETLSHLEYLVGEGKMERYNTRTMGRPVAREYRNMNPAAISSA